MPRPKRDILNKGETGAGSATRAGGTYVSPYGARNNRVSPGAPGNRSTGGYSGSRTRPGVNVPAMPGSNTRVARGGSIGS